MSCTSCSGAGASGVSQASVGLQIQMAVAAKQLAIAADQGAAIVALIQSAQAPAQEPGKGMALDVQA